jgi:cupin 2 domain-containing protein
MKPPTGNLFASIPEHMPSELSAILQASNGVEIERIVSRGQCSPDGFWYDQERAEWVVIISGAAHLEFDDGSISEMSTGDYVNIPAHCRHRVTWTDPNQDTIWLAVHYEG